MTPLKCVHLNSVTRFILITILVSIFSQSFDCKPTNSVTIEGNISQPIDNSTIPVICLNKAFEFPECIFMAPEIITVNNDTTGPVVKRAVHPPEDQQYQTTSVSLLSTNETETVYGNNNVIINLATKPTEINATPDEILTLSGSPDTTVSSLSISESTAVYGNNSFWTYQNDTNVSMVTV